MAVDKNKGSDSRSSPSSQGKGQQGQRGFASMDPKQQREIASLGGQTAHAKGTAHEFTSEEAREAARSRGNSNRNQPEQRV